MGIAFLLSPPFAYVFCKMRVLSVCYLSAALGAPAPTPAPKCTKQCDEEDRHAYCGTSNQSTARFNDGSGCSCVWDFHFDHKHKRCISTIELGAAAPNFKGWMASRGL